MAQPKVWLQTDGETTTVHTPFTTRAKDDFGRGVVPGRGSSWMDFCLEDFGSSFSRKNYLLWDGVNHIYIYMEFIIYIICV